MKIGIDFGTCFSKIAVLDDNGPTIRCIRNSNDGIPSLFLNLDDDQRFGVDCLDVTGHEKKMDIVRNMKTKFMNGETTIYSGGKKFEIEYVIKGYLQYLVDKAKFDADQYRTRHNFPESTIVEEVTISSPIESVNTSCRYHNFLKKAMMEITGLNEEKVHVIEEPEAAAIAYLGDPNNSKIVSEKNPVLLIFDLGGGTLDITIIQKTRSNHWKVLAKAGDPNLGGNDWDDILYRELVGNQCVIDYDEYELRKVITDAKKRLSQSSKTRITLFDVSGERDFFEGNNTLTRETFEEWTRPLLDRAREVVSKALNEFNRGADNIDHVVVVGGASNMPQISNMLKGMFGEDKVHSYDPIFAVCLGNAIQNGIDESIATHSYSLKSRDKDGNVILWTLIYKGEPFDKYGKVQKQVKTLPYDENNPDLYYHIYESIITRDGTSLDHARFDEVKKQYPVELIRALDVPIKMPPNNCGRFECDLVLTLTKDGIVELSISHNGKELGRSIVGDD